MVRVFGRYAIFWAFLSINFQKFAVDCSDGDVNVHFQKCVHAHKAMCKDSSTNQVYNFTPFTIVDWSCYEQVKYDCMRNHNFGRLTAGLPVMKYYGHWCFERYFGLEEPGSVLFSILNILPHFNYILKYIIAKPAFIRDPWLAGYALIGMNGWIASTVFHSHKTDIHINYDYISALIFLSYGLMLAIRRVLKFAVKTYVINAILSFGWFLIFWRIREMIRGKVTFDAHMTLCIAIVVITTSLWVFWCLWSAWQVRHYQRKINMKLRWKNLACQIWLMIASSLELFDFPAYLGIFDAHALW